MDASSDSAYESPALLSEEDKQTINARYSSRFQHYGRDLRTLNPGTDRHHRIQHEVHASIAQLEGASILDIGCGLAHYYEFLLSLDLNVTYTGYDISESFIEDDRRRFPGAHFEVRDIFREGIAHRADYITMCQVFNNRYTFSDNYSVVKCAISKSFEAATKGVSIDLKSTYVNYQEDHLFYFSPEVMFTFAKSLTRYVTLRHDYMPYDFTLFLYKERTTQ